MRTISHVSACSGLDVWSKQARLYHSCRIQPIAVQTDGTGCRGETEKEGNMQITGDYRLSIVGHSAFLLWQPYADSQRFAMRQIEPTMSASLQKEICIRGLRILRGLVGSVHNLCHATCPAE